MTDNQQISDLALRALAAFVHEVRPEWDAPGIVTALRARRDLDPWQLAQAMIRRASDPANTTPLLQPFDEPTLIGCRQHPGAAVRTDGACGVCLAESLGVDEPYTRKAIDGCDPHPLRSALERVK